MSHSWSEKLDSWQEKKMLSCVKTCPNNIDKEYKISLLIM